MVFLFSYDPHVDFGWSRLEIFQWLWNTQSGVFNILSKCTVHSQTSCRLTCAVVHFSDSGCQKGFAHPFDWIVTLHNVLAFERLNSRLKGKQRKQRKPLLDLLPTTFHWDVDAFQITIKPEEQLGKCDITRRPSIHPIHLWHPSQTAFLSQEFVWALYFPHTELKFGQKMEGLWWLFWTYVSQQNLSELCWRSVSWMK